MKYLAEMTGHCVDLHAALSQERGAHCKGQGFVRKLQNFWLTYSCYKWCWGLMLNKWNFDLWPEFSFAFRMVFHLSPRNFYLKSFPFCTTGIPAQQRHFVVHVQSNNQSTKPMTEEDIMWGHLVCWYHGIPLWPVELCTDRSCFVSKQGVWHTPMLVLCW